MKILQNIGIGGTPSQNTATVTAPSQQTTITDMTNIRYPRNFVLNNGFLIMSHSNVSAGIALEDVALGLITLEPTLTWPPVIQQQPVDVSAATGIAVFYQFVVSSEVNVTYQWYVSTDNGNSYNPIANGPTGGGGNYSNVTTFQLGISDATGLNGNLYQCVATNVSGFVTSRGALMTIT